MLRGLRTGELLDAAFARLVGQVPARDRAWLHELVYGTVRLRGRIDSLLQRFVRRSLDSLDADVLDILRLGAYQLLEMRSVPAYAAVSQSVELAKSVSGRGAGGFVNGVLQSMRRAHEMLDAVADRNTIAELSAWGSHPRWLVQRWVAQFGPDATARLVEANNLRPELFVRPVGITIERAIELLARENIAGEPVRHAPDAVRVAGAVLQGSTGQTEGYTPTIAKLLETIPAVVQDPAAGLVVRYAAIDGGTVADLCAAPGGKALAMTGAEGPTTPGYIVASDRSYQRLLRVVENARRLQTDNVGFIVADGRMPPLRTLDHVLLDAPCTGTGTLRRHPDGKWRLTAADLDALTTLQRELLESAATLVRPGGLLVYSTCSLEKEENEEQVKFFLENHPDYRIEAPAEFDATMLDAQGMLHVLPQVHGFDGAFAARLRRAH